MPEAHCHLHVGHPVALTIAEVRFQRRHHPLESGQQRLVIATSRFSEFPDRHQELPMGSDVFRFPGLPVKVAEFLIDLFQLLCTGVHGLVVTGVIDEEPLGCEELLENVFVIFKNVFHEHVGFIDQSADRLFARTEAGVVLEYLLSFRVSEEVPEKSELMG